MFPTFVFGWPQGNEEGDFLAVDLGKLATHLFSRQGINVEMQVGPTSVFVW